MQNLIVTVGLPRSGKSTYAMGTGFPVVNPDSIRLAIHGEAFIPLAEPYVWAVAETMVRALFVAGHDTVVLDATNTTTDRRKQWERFRKEGVCVTFRVFDTPKEECIKRAVATGKENLIPVIERMYAAYEPISEEA